MWTENSDTKTVGQRRESRRSRRGGLDVLTPTYSRYPPTVDRRDRPRAPAMSEPGEDDVSPPKTINVPWRNPMKTVLRWGAPLVMTGLLALVSVPAMAQSAHEKQLYEAAKKEGQLTWYSGVLNQQICNEVGKAFSQKYPGIDVHAIKTTSQVAFQRLLQDIKAGQILSDVFTTTDESHMGYLEGKHLLIKYVPENEKGLSKVLRGIDPNGYYHVSWVGIVALVYNKNKVTAANAPKDWPDLTN